MSEQVTEASNVRVTTWSGFVLMRLGMFMAILDIPVVPTSLPTIQDALAISPDAISWIQTAYLIAEIIAIPLDRMAHARPDVTLVVCQRHHPLYPRLYWLCVQQQLGDASELPRGSRLLRGHADPRGFHCWAPRKIAPFVNMCESDV
jgi:hypothetical protein